MLGLIAFLLLLGLVIRALDKRCELSCQAELAYWADFQNQLNLENQAMRQRWAREDAERAAPIPLEVPEWITKPLEVRS